ncbi:MAG: flagellar M-ring protein FliF [Nitrospirae bacterium]|nr:flagellar M-ring protein FliF [Nitrospirota bacterium]MCL5237172.1 flagellar M-ring protein FliF [Nitrospirota bacterium]
MALIDVINLIKSWPLKKKIALVSIMALSIALMAGIMLWSNRVDYQVLYSNLTQEDAGQVITKLKELKVPYNVEGNTIYVPGSKVYELRLELAAQGIPQGGGVGFEIFDKTQIGVTEFVQRLNYIRALQGELARTIRQLSEVDQARVHIAIPERTIFTEKEEKPTASVVLKLKPGRVLNQGQIGGIVHLVSSSVEGLPPQNVAIIDNMGNLLSKPSAGDMIADAKQLEYQKSVDKDYESKLQSMLEGIVGRGKALVRVATKIDFTQVERTEEKFDPDTTAVRSEQRTQEKSAGSVSGGIPGVLSNQPGQQPAAASGSPSSSQKQSENINYEVSRSVSKILQPRGEVKNISVAVLVDGTYKKAKDKKVYSPRSEEELKKYEEIVKASVGFNKERGDQVIVQNMPFETAVEDIPEKTDYLKIITSLLKYIVPIIAVVLLILFVIKPVIEALKAPVEISPRPAAELLRTAHELPEQETTPEEIMKDQMMDVVKKDPRRAATILREWLSE